MHMFIADLLILVQVLMIDLVLAGDNAVVIGLAVGRLAPAQRRQAIIIGIGAATILRIALALIALRLIAVIGLTLAGGILLLYVAWKSWREFAHALPHKQGGAPQKLGGAVLRILLADLSMSLDNVLAVAGAARNHPWLLAGGLIISIAMMGVAAQLVAGLLARYRWLVWAGLAIVLYVAFNMIWDGWLQVGPLVSKFFAGVAG